MRLGKGTSLSYQGWLLLLTSLHSMIPLGTRFLMLLLLETHLPQLLSIVLRCRLHRQLGIDGDDLAVRDWQFGQQVRL